MLSRLKWDWCLKVKRRGIRNPWWQCKDRHHASSPGGQVWILGCFVRLRIHISLPQDLSNKLCAGRGFWLRTWDTVSVSTRLTAGRKKRGDEIPFGVDPKYTVLSVWCSLVYVSELANACLVLLRTPGYWPVGCVADSHLDVFGW